MEFIGKKVTAVITTHKRSSEVLKRAIDSVLAQTYNNIEIIVVDDAPYWEQHKTIVELILSYGDRVKYIENDERPGACGSRNIGIAKATGEYIALLDDDDVWKPQKIEKMIEEFDEDTGLVYCNFEIVKKKSVETGGRRIYEGYVLEEMFLYGNFIGGCSIPLIKAKVLQEECGFDEKLPAAQDYDMWLRICKKYKVKFLDLILVSYYFSQDAITSSSNRHFKAWTYLLDKYADEYAIRPQAKDRMQKNIIYRLASDGKIKDAWKYGMCVRDGVGQIKSVAIILKGMIKYIAIALKFKDR